ncbi:MAG TPA: Ig-like domain-containing protein [Longimicrobium sp.]|nr:Ig-like domain-containing protein [Longimicrobium sp.]
MRIRNRISALAMLLLAGCGEPATDGVTPTGPRLLVGPTTRVSVSCPAQMEVGTSGTCTAYGYDAGNSFTSSTVSAWSSSNTSRATISSAGAISAIASGSVTIAAVVDGVSGSTTVSVVDPPPPLKVVINGPSAIRPYSTCTWFAAASGGTPPYTYQWSGGSSGGGSGNEYTASASANFSFSVQVTDALGKVVGATKWVLVSNSAMECMV